MSSSRTQSSSSSVWQHQYMKLHFFSRIRSLFKSKASSRKRDFQSSTQISRTQQYSEKVVAPPEILSKPPEEENEEVVLQRTVKKLHFGTFEEKEKAAIEIEKLSREDKNIRKLMAELGVLQVLVSMVASDISGHQRSAVMALIQLSHGTHTNKALMVNAGICSKLPKNVEVLDQSTRYGFAELLLSLSSLTSLQLPVASSQILPFLMETMNSDTTEMKCKEICLATINNLCLVLENARPLVTNGAIKTLLSLILVKDLSEKALASLGQLILTWEEKPKCQEYTAYILMVLAHQSWSQREKMAKAGIVPVLLEVTLLGSPLVQKRAVKLLQWFKDERNVRMGPHSGPQTSRVSSSIGSPMSPRSGEEGKNVMKNLVKQSLYKNMEMITRRGNVDLEREACRLKSSLIISTSSKSLTY
ncbi:BnaC03g47140D [Brassica napus]|uniref:BnaC03g47140D protein n=1 Tax=Brassica napus TaxID=3708 RepID=A0A078H114_BRANA|nr:BnaC03g47140D [Brassica napus]